MTSFQVSPPPVPRWMDTEPRERCSLQPSQDVHARGCLSYLYYCFFSSLSFILHARAFFCFRIVHVNLISTIAFFFLVLYYTQVLLTSFPLLHFFLFFFFYILHARSYLSYLLYCIFFFITRKRLSILPPLLHFFFFLYCTQEVVYLNPTTTFFFFFTQKTVISPSLLHFSLFFYILSASRKTQQRRGSAIKTTNCFDKVWRWVLWHHSAAGMWVALPPPVRAPSLNSARCTPNRAYHAAFCTVPATTLSHCGAYAGDAARTMV